MSVICLENGKVSAFGLSPGTSTVEEIEDRFGAAESVETIEGAQLYTFAEGAIQAAREDNHLCISTLWVNAEAAATKEMPKTLLQLQDIFLDLKVAERPENGILLAECSGLKVACDWAGESQKVIWLELTQPK